MNKQEIQEEKFKGIYQLITDNNMWTTAKQRTFTRRCAFKHLETFLKYPTLLVIINVEVVKYLIDLGYPEAQITFLSDDPIKQELFLQGINCTVLPFNDETIMKYKKKFDGGAINPPFDYSIQFRKIAQDLIKEQLIAVLPNRDLEDANNLKNISFYKNLSNTAFDEAIYTSLLIVECNKTPESVTVENTDGTSTTVVEEMNCIPQNDLDKWLFAEKVFALGLHGMNSYNSGGMYANKLKKVPNGIPTIFKVGKLSAPDFLLAYDVDPKYKSKLKGLGKHKLVVSRAANPYKVTAGKYAGPEWAVGESVVAVDFDTKEEALEAVEYYNSKKVEKLIEGFASRKSNNQQFFSRIPHPKYSKKWNEKL